MIRVACLVFVFCTFWGKSTNAQLLLNADGPGDTYPLITSKLAPGYNPIEVPDCGHGSFGEHIDEIFDNDLNTNVFRFHLHVNEDDDRCINFDRQRCEIKTYDQSPDSLLGVSGENVQYTWKFKLDAGFQSSPNFTHIHQLKAVGGTESSMPLITLTTRASSPDRLELRYAETTSQITLASTDLAPFKGEWVNVVETVTYGENGSYDINITQESNNASLFSYTDGDIRMWKTDASFIRPKWGIYRSLINASYLRDEEVLFANFSIEELPTSNIVTWDGGANTNNWTDPLNWDVNLIPSASNIVLIPVSNATVNLMGNSTIKRLYVSGGAQLTIASNSTLNIDGANIDDGLATSPTGTIINNGNINILNIVGQDGIYNKGNFTNNGTISIDGVGQHGVYLKGGAFTTSAGSQLSVTNVGQSISGDHIYADDSEGTGSTFTNHGTIDITMVTGDDGIYVNDGSVFNNTSVINLSIGAGASGDESIYAEDFGVFNNLAGGLITISSSNDVALQAKNNGSINNNGGTITIGAVPDHQIFLDNATSFSNSGIINLNNGTKNGIYLTDASIFTNSANGILNITGAANYGIQIDANSESSPATLNNFGSITITNGSKDGLRMQEGAVMMIHANGTLNISGVGDDAIQLDQPSILNNSGLIDIINSTDHGIELFSNCNNDGIINLTDIGDNGINAINQSNLTNSESGIINISHSTKFGILIDANSMSSPANLTNYGTITITNDNDSGLRIQEDGILTNQINGTLNCISTNQEGIIVKPTGVLNNNGVIKLSEHPE